MMRIRRSGLLHPFLDCAAGRELDWAGWWARRGQNGGSSVQSGIERLPGGGVGLAAAALATWRGATVLSTGKLVVRVRH